MLWYLRLGFASAQPSRIGAEYVDCTSRIGAEWGAEFAELPSIIRRGLVLSGVVQGGGEGVSGSPCKLSILVLGLGLPIPCLNHINFFKFRNCNRRGDTCTKMILRFLL